MANAAHHCQPLAALSVRRIRRRLKNRPSDPRQGILGRNHYQASIWTLRLATRQFNTVIGLIGSGVLISPIQTGEFVMPNAIDNARKRLAALRNQVAELERFIQMYEELKEGADADKSDTHASRLSGALIGNKPVDNFPHDRRRKRGRPAEIVTIIERIIREAGRPLTRGEIVEALERRDVHIPAEDKQRYVGTIAWRHKSVFGNVGGLGYWLTGEPLPKAMGLPLDSEPASAMD
jgi:hypothetical protein